MLENIKAVIFDLDGTLVDSMWVWRDIDINYLQDKGSDILIEDLESEIEGMSFTETAMYFKEKFNIEDSVEDIKEEWNRLAFEYYSKKILLKDGAREFIKYLKQNDIKLGIGTSNSRELAEAVLLSNGILDYFDTFITSCEAGKGKPNPDVFLKAAKNLDVKPEECIVFEDTYAGVLAGVRAGMKVYGVADALSLINKDKISKLVEKYIISYFDLEVLAKEEI
ncbi:HAD family hydrolase [Abyssisolibacter fermentans]|uniref:HAD family hydrolase n=1 Tax=Abyssisolibacter fermentans TaxID=1766203 RepID=UPI00082E6FCE|nr:HAD family phosphatase [Abyssisolibacter fermentans]